MNRKEMKQLLEERFDRIALLETRIDTMEQLVDGYHAREQSLIDTLHTAQSTAKRLVEEARTEAETIREQARREGVSLLEEKSQAAQAALQQAEQQARELRTTAKNESDRLMRDAEIIKREYEELVTSFNAMLEQNASELRETAARFADFIKTRKVETPEVRLDGEAFYKSVGAMNDAKLPDPDGDPATLMKNIYQLQKRPMPAAEDTAAEESGESVAQSAETGDEQPAAAPFSEQAWTNEHQQSMSEPQAEFTPAFDPAFLPTDFVANASECAVPAEEAEHAFDEYFSAQTFSEAQQAATDANAGTAWQAEQANNDQQPHEAAQQVFDEFFSGSFEPAGKTAQDEVAPEQAAGPEGAAPEPYSEQAWTQGTFLSNLEPQAEGALAFDALFAEGTAEHEPVAEGKTPTKERSASAEEARREDVAEAAAPEPYSEQAWTQDAFLSSHEPQAEGALAFDTLFGENDSNGASESSYASEEEPREWEPEHEPEADEIPTVSQLVSRSNEEEVSLDALLEEIIRAGE